VTIAQRPGLHLGGRQWLDILALGVLWGCSYLFFKVLSATLPAFTIVMGRVGLAAVFLILVLAATRQRLPRTPTLWGQLAILGLINNVIPFSLSASGIRHIPSGLGAILNIATPVFTVVMAHLLTRDEKLTRRAVVGIVVAATGVMILVGPAALGQTGRASLAGQLMILAASLSFAVAAVYGRRLRAHPPLTVATGQLIASAVIVSPLALVFDRPWTLPAPSAEVWGALLGISVLSSGLAYILFFRILAAAGAGASQLVTFIIPIVAVVLGWLVLGEQLPLRAYVGMVTIALGLLVIERRMLAAAVARVFPGR
jgi:drug/metabolite transporter (DMT)-like permease